MLSLFVEGCDASSASANHRKFGVDSSYYIGMRKLNDGLEKEARPYFNKCAKRGSYYCARRSAEMLTTLGTHEQRKKACDFLIKKFPDSDSKIIVGKEYLYLNELSKILQITNDIDLSTEKNELIKIRLDALKRSKDPVFYDEAIKWFYQKPTSDVHYQFYRDDLAPSFKEELTPTEYSINFRISIYRRDYKMAMEELPLLLEYFKNGSLQITQQFASDIGKTYLYSTTDYGASGKEVYQLAQDFAGTCAEFYFLFYSGRLFDKAELYRTKSAECYEKAIRVTEDASQIDNALWYLLTSKLSYSVDSIVDKIDLYARMWNDAEYFDDFLESFLSTLLICGKWDSLYTVYTKIDGKATDESVAKFAYMYGRLLQEGYAKVGQKEDKNQKIRNAFYRSCESGTAIYYKLLSAYELGFSTEEVFELLQKNPVPSYKGQWTDKDAEKYLIGFAVFGLPEKIYPEWLELYKDKISVETSMYLADFLQKCSNGNDGYYAQALRIASRAANRSAEPLTKEQLKQIYPRNYENFVTKYSETYEIDPSVVFALIRSESFFDSTIVSSAGAIGLTQLMAFTAGDIARKFKMSAYDLNDPETNIRFGTYYLSELTKRCDDSLLMAFFSYNAGISRVRRWQQTSLREFGKKKNMPGDLFLEAIPYSETREYGRKLVSASLIYSLLYYPEEFDTFAKAVEKLVY